MKATLDLCLGPNWTWHELMKCYGCVDKVAVCIEYGWGLLRRLMVV